MPTMLGEKISVEEGMCCVFEVVGHAKSGYDLQLGKLTTRRQLGLRRSPGPPWNTSHRRTTQSFLNVGLRLSVRCYIPKEECQNREPSMVVSFFGFNCITVMVVK